MRGLLKATSDALNIQAQAYPEIPRKSLLHVEEQELSGDVDPARLIDLLEQIDRLKQEVQDRIRRIEAVNQAKTLLQEDGIRTEALDRKLAEAGKALGEIRPQLLTTEAKNREADLLGLPTTESLARIHPSTLRPLTDERQPSDRHHRLDPPSSPGDGDHT